MDPKDLCDNEAWGHPHWFLANQTSCLACQLGTWCLMTSANNQQRFTAVLRCVKHFSQRKFNIPKIILPTSEGALGLEGDGYMCS